jgi:hypothetical protein
MRDKRKEINRLFYITDFPYKFECSSIKPEKGRFLKESQGYFSKIKATSKMSSIQYDNHNFVRTGLITSLGYNYIA